MKKKKIYLIKKILGKIPKIFSSRQKPRHNNGSSAVIPLSTTTKRTSIPESTTNSLESSGRTKILNLPNGVTSGFTFPDGEPVTLNPYAETLIPL